MYCNEKLLVQSQTQKKNHFDFDKNALQRCDVTFFLKNIIVLVQNAGMKKLFFDPFPISILSTLFVLIMRSSKIFL